MKSTYKVLSKDSRQAGTAELRSSVLRLSQCRDQQKKPGFGYELLQGAGYAAGFRQNFSWR